MRKTFEHLIAPALKVLNSPAVLTAIIICILLGYGFSVRFFLSQISEMQSSALAVRDASLKTKADLTTLQKDQTYLSQRALDDEMKAIEKALDLSSSSYEELIKLNGDTTNDLEKEYVEILSLLSKRNYASATAQIAVLNTTIKKEQAKQSQSAASAIPKNVQTNNTPPGSGYQRQYVKNEYGTYLVDVIAADLNFSKVVVDTASDGTCTNDCPVMSIGDYASRSGAFAAINGPYFCPADYPSCADKKNSFDTLLMNKNKVYFNSDNNVYSTVPAVIFSGNSARFVTQSLEWGRDTGVDTVIAGQPLLLLNGNVVFGGDNEIKRSGKGSRSFIGTTGSTVYIGVVRSANVAEVAQVLKTMGIQNALNLDSGGSTALWNGGRYIAGPGRNLPFGILIVSK